MYVRLKPESPMHNSTILMSKHGNNLQRSLTLSKRSASCILASNCAISFLRAPACQSINTMDMDMDTDMDTNMDMGGRLAQHNDNNNNLQVFQLIARYLLGVS